MEEKKNKANQDGNITFEDIAQKVKMDGMTVLTDSKTETTPADVLAFELADRIYNATQKVREAGYKFPTEKLRELRDLLKQINAQALSAFYDELEILGPFLEEELKKPEYKGKTLENVLHAYTAGDLLEMAQDPDSFFYKAMENARTAIIESGEGPTELIEEIHGQYNLPFGPWLYTTLEAMEHAITNRPFTNITKGGRKQSDRNKQLIVEPINGGSGFRLTEKKGTDYNSVTVVNKELIKSTSVLKLFVFLLIKANQQNFNPVISFPLSELVNVAGMYGSISAARAGIEEHIIAVQSIQVAGTIKKGKKTFDSNGGSFFYHHEIKNNVVKIWVNENIDISHIASFYTILPPWAFKLSSKAFELALYVFMRSRTERKANFNISLSIIREKLSLPTAEEYKQSKPDKKWKPGQYVKKPIMEAIEEIKKQIEIEAEENISIQEHYIVNPKNLEEWLKGYISITLSGDYSNNLNEIKNKQTKIIEDNTKRKEAAKAAAELKKQEK